MKIVNVETFNVPPRWLLVRVETDAGVAGWGEPVLEGRARTAEAAVHEFADYLIGRDPARIEDHWQVMTKAGFFRGGPVFSSAVAGLDQALWDIAGKVHGVPVHVLLGGPVRDRVRVYGWIGGDRPDDVAAAAARSAERGFTAVKMNGSGEMAFIDTAARARGLAERAAAVREAIGPERDFAVDFHGRLSPAMSRRVLSTLEPSFPMFVEEPTVPELAHHLASIAACTTVPIAVGERLYSRQDFREVLQSGIAVAQPDVSHAGGISEMRRIGAMAETFGVALAPHNPNGPVSLAASLQVALATPNLLIQEMSLGMHYNEGAEIYDYVDNPEVLEPHDGFVARLDGPGLGIEVDEQAVRRAAAQPFTWRAPVWRYADGSLAEW